jgi:diguanylate cyclase (GGDEF)-like protein/PAS domain S-box-containing protein
MPFIQFFKRTPGKPLALGLLALAAIALLALIAWGLNNTYQDRMQRSRHQAERELMAIGHLQAEGASAWREQRMADALALTDDSLFAGSAARWFKTDSQESTKTVQERLRILQERAKYVAVYLVDLHGQLRLTADGPGTQKLPEPELQAMQEAIAQAAAVAVEPRVDPAFAFPFFSVIAPLYEGTEPIGAVWLVSDVRSTLYPLLGIWPTPSETAESSIVARQGNELVYHSPLRQVADANLNVRSLLSRTSDPAVQAILGARGIYRAQDYRAKDVIAMASAVPNSPWVVVTKIDEAEVIASTQNRELLALGMPVILGLLLIGILFALWQRSAWLRERALKTELQRNMRWLEGAQKAATVGYFSLDVETQRFVMSHMADSIFGTTSSSLANLTQWTSMLHPDERQGILGQHLQAMKQRTSLRTQYRIFRGDDQQIRWIEAWCENELDPSTQRVTHMIGTVQDITERKKTEEELARYRTALEEKVRLDPLTQLANRRALDECVATEWQRATRGQTALSLLMIDVDFFKAYNDHYGHVAGDHCLQKVAQTIAASANRAGELSARYGGEEFAVLLPDAEPAQAMLTAERICAAVRALDIPHAFSDAGNSITVSIGVVCLHPVFVENTESDATPPTQAMFEQADIALYQAKQQGRNCAVLFKAPD